MTLKFPFDSSVAEVQESGKKGEDGAGLQGEGTQGGREASSRANLRVRIRGRREGGNSGRLRDQDAEGDHSRAGDRNPAEGATRTKGCRTRRLRALAEEEKRRL